jgi:hypothetical protein
LQTMRAIPWCLKGHGSLVSCDCHCCWLMHHEATLPSAKPDAAKVQASAGPRRAERKRA